MPMNDAERAVLARSLGGEASADDLQRALSSFGALADDVERRLTSVEELYVEASPPGADPLERGLLEPPG